MTMSPNHQLTATLIGHEARSLEIGRDHIFSNITLNSTGEAVCIEAPVSSSL